VTGVNKQEDGVVGLQVVPDCREDRKVQPSKLLDGSISCVGVS